MIKTFGNVYHFLESKKKVRHNIPGCVNSLKTVHERIKMGY